jgi:threonine synthase
MVKAFDEMEALGWIGSRRPRMVSVQAAGCAPIVRAFEKGEVTSAPWDNPRTTAWGLRVPSPLGDFLILRGVRRTGGTAVSVTEEEMEQSSREMATQEGILAGWEGGASLAALKRLVEAGRVVTRDRIVLFNTGTGLKCLDNMRGDRRA